MMLSSSLARRSLARLVGRPASRLSSFGVVVHPHLVGRKGFSTRPLVDDVNGTGKEEDEDEAEAEEAEEAAVFGHESLADSGEWAGCKRSFMAPLKISVRGTDILHHPLYNKGTAFKSGERDRLRIRGLLPARVMNIVVQKERFLAALRSEQSSIRKNMLLEDLHDRNETLYHRVLIDHIEEMAPLIYTPTVGQACMEFATRYRRPRGMYFTEEDRGHMAASK
jgi:Malic enzyme, N-terminal domain